MEFESLILFVHYVACVLLIIAVMLQSGKGADAGAALGAAGSGTVFGNRGAATFLSKLTIVISVVFLATSLTLVILSNKTAKSALPDSLPMTQTESIRDGGEGETGQAGTAETTEKDKE